LLPPSHTGVVPLQCPLPRQATHMPAATLQTGVAPLQRLALLAEHWPQAPPGWHAGSAPPHSVSAAQPRQLRLPVSQTPVGAAQSVLARQPTQRPAAVSHSGVAPVHAAAFDAEHWPHAPPGWHAGVDPPHSPSPAHARHTCVARLQTGVAPPQPVLATQPTQTPGPMSHAGFAPVHKLLSVAEHWPHAPLA
jgi:hypothetical protein